MSYIDIDRNEVVTHRLSQSAIDELNEKIVRDEDGNIDTNNLPSGIELVGVGLCDSEGGTYIDDDIRKALAGGATCLLCKLGDQYCNLWVGADEKNYNGFDDQVELHFES